MNQEAIINIIILEGVLDILDSKPPYLIEMHLSAFAKEKRQKLAAEALSPAEQPAQV